MTWKRNKRGHACGRRRRLRLCLRASTVCATTAGSPDWPGTSRWRSLSRHLAAGEHRHYCVRLRQQSAVYGVIWSYGGADLVSIGYLLRSGVDRLFAPAACRVELRACCARLPVPAYLLIERANHSPSPLFTTRKQRFCEAYIFFVRV